MGIAHTPAKDQPIDTNQRPSREEPMGTDQTLANTIQWFLKEELPKSALKTPNQ